ncbi:MAG: hypothetical protein M5U07_09755 [Xanthobacteraceae bacterium]|nr:hypothetical protein [Xanthobacteraceae bacterium]
MPVWPAVSPRSDCSAYSGAPAICGMYRVNRWSCLFSPFLLIGVHSGGDLRQVDQALRAVDIHPRLVPEAVKLALVGLLKECARGGEPAAPAYRAAAEIVGYCMIGADAFAAANDAQLAREVEERIELALISGTNLDARLVLLTLHAGVCQASVVDRFQLESAAN